MASAEAEAEAEAIHRNLLSHLILGYLYEASGHGSAAAACAGPSSAPSRLCAALFDLRPHCALSYCVQQDQNLYDINMMNSRSRAQT